MNHDSPSMCHKTSQLLVMLTNFVSMGCNRLYNRDVVGFKSAFPPIRHCTLRVNPLQCGPRDRFLLLYTYYIH